MTVREILKVLRKDGWYTTNQEGSHINLKHQQSPEKSQYQTTTET
jgi:predicted RNA binding protein YcfA (HicA-like mRNA interferase family)